jgi:hypothetical protein
MAAIMRYTMVMIVLLHILIALGSIIYSGYVFFSPSKTKIRASYCLVAATLISGTYLVISTHSPILSSCVTGLIYLAIVMFGILAADNKLRKLSSNK